MIHVMSHSVEHPLNWNFFFAEDKFVGLLLVMGSFFVTVLLVYGAAKVGSTE